MGEEIDCGVFLVWSGLCRSRSSAMLFAVLLVAPATARSAPPTQPIALDAPADKAPEPGGPGDAAAATEASVSHHVFVDDSLLQGGGRARVGGFFDEYVARHAVAGDPMTFTTPAHLASGTPVRELTFTGGARPAWNVMARRPGKRGGAFCAEAAGWWKELVVARTAADEAALAVFYAGADVGDCAELASGIEAELGRGARVVVWVQAAGDVPPAIAELQSDHGHAVLAGPRDRLVADPRWKGEWALGKLGWLPDHARNTAALSVAAIASARFSRLVSRPGLRPLRVRMRVYNDDAALLRTRLKMQGRAVPAGRWLWWSAPASQEGKADNLDGTLEARFGSDALKVKRPAMLKLRIAVEVQGKGLADQGDAGELPLRLKTAPLKLTTSAPPANVRKSTKRRRRGQGRFQPNLLSFARNREVVACRLTADGRTAKIVAAARWRWSFEAKGGAKLKKVVADSLQGTKPVAGKGVVDMVFAQRKAKLPGGSKRRQVTVRIVEAGGWLHPSPTCSRVYKLPRSKKGTGSGGNGGGIPVWALALAGLAAAGGVAAFVMRGRGKAQGSTDA